jgi:hypothetical protein
MLTTLRRELLTTRINANLPGQNANDQNDHDTWTCETTAA